MKIYDRQISLDWVVGYAGDADGTPEKFVRAVVPGAVQLDIARAEGYPDYTYAGNYKMFGWMEDMHYFYRTTFAKPTLKTGERLRFISKGIDYRFVIFLNGQELHAQEGMFTWVDIDLTEHLADENILTIHISPVPKRNGCPDDRTQASNVVKPAVSYLWDWHPRLVPLGIWDETYLEIRLAPHVGDLHVDYSLEPDFSAAEITLTAETSDAEGCRWSWTLRDAQGKAVLTGSGSVGGSKLAEYRFTNPKLWWPHDHGTPYLYTSEFTLIGRGGSEIQTIVSKVGFRRVKLVMNEGAWNEPNGFPKTRSAAPAQFEVNGRRIFAKGTNWVNPEIFPGVITGERYKELLVLAIGANFNILRMWGGSIVNKESFYDLCDEMGLLVWQEFPLACNKYPDDPHYLKILEQEGGSIIKRLRKHACIAMWCGGNELFNSWSRMTDQSLALRLLNSLCLHYDPLTPFDPTSPMIGMAHGHYIFKWHGVEVFELINNSHYTAYSEFGMPGASPREVIEKIIPPEELFPPRPGTAWEEHHAFHAWDGDMYTWLSCNLLEEYFVPAQDLDDLIEQSQALQCVGYKAIFEESRRQKPYCAMALNWCFNEPWPAAANNSLVAWPSLPKPALKAVGDSCRPFCTSARFSKFVWREGEEFFADIWLLNDKFADHSNLKIKVTLVSGEEEIVILDWNAPTVPANRNLAGPTVRFALPRWESERFHVRVEIEGHPEYDSQYLLLYRKAEEEIKRTRSMNL